MSDEHGFEGAREGLRQMVDAINSGVVEGDEKATSMLVNGAVLAEVKLKLFLNKLGLSKGTKLAALLREMEQVSSKLALLGQKARLSRDSNAKELAKAQATLLRETLKDIINECRRLRDQNVQSPSPQKQQQQQQQQVSEPRSARAARELAIEAARFALWAREEHMSGRKGQSEQFLQRAGVLVGLAKELGEEGECKRCTALLVTVAKKALYEDNGEMATVQEVLMRLEEQLKSVRSKYGEKFVDVAYVRPLPDGGLVVKDELAADDASSLEELALLENQLDTFSTKWQKPFAQGAEYEEKYKQALARKDLRRVGVEVKRASSAAQVAAMRSNLEQQEDNLALQRRQLEALETQLKEEEEKEDIPQQYPDAKEHGDRGMSTAGGFLVVNRTTKGKQQELQRTETKIRPAAPTYK